MYESFDTFLQTAIREHYNRTGAKNRTRFVALLIVSGEALPMAFDALKGMLSPGRLAAGALGAVALRLAIRWAFGGPLGLLLTGVTVASLVTFYLTHQEEIRGEVVHTRSTVDRVRRDYRSIQERFLAGRFTADERTLMIDGLLQRFLRELENPPSTAVDVVARTPEK